MPWLVHERKGSPGKWEVAWTWMPYFLASDKELIKYVDEKMTEELSKAQLSVPEMHKKVLELILQRHSMLGLKHYLEAVIHVYPDEPDEQPAS